MPAPTPPARIRLHRPRPQPEAVTGGGLAELRRCAPIWCNEQTAGGAGPFGDGGYWVVTKHRDVKEISKRSDVFSSLKKTALPRYPEGSTAEQIETGKFVLLNMDAPHHTHLRKIISRGFTPRAVERLREDLNERAQNIAKAAAAEGSGAFVEQVSCELPRQAIAGLIGIPLEDRKKIFDWSNQMVADDDPEFAHHDGRNAATELIMYAMELAAIRAKEPGEDIVTKLVEADVDGHKLSDDEFGFFMVLLAVAGSETTRNSITHGMIAMAEHPDQWDLYEQGDGVAVGHGARCACARTESATRRRGAGSGVRRAGTRRAGHGGGAGRGAARVGGLRPESLRRGGQGMVDRPGSTRRARCCSTVSHRPCWSDRMRCGSRCTPTVWHRVSAASRSGGLI